MTEPTKEDYNKAREIWAARVINIEAELVAAKAGFEYCANKVAEFPEDDPMPEEIKDIVKEVASD